MWIFDLITTLPIQGYGVAVCSGVLSATLVASRHSLCRRVGTVEQFFDCVAWASLVGIIGARLGHVITEWSSYTTCIEMAQVWRGGLSSLGMVTALIFFIPWYAKKREMPLFPLLDLVALHAPLAHGISRFGCLWAGCCGGIASSVYWAIPSDEGVMVHPTQLYSAFFLLLFYRFMQWVSLQRNIRPGMLSSFYLSGVGIERFVVDFWRNDRIMNSAHALLSTHQYFACGIIACGLTVWLLSSTLHARQAYTHV